MSARPQGPEDGLAWVTGAGKGLGRALSLRLAAEGWSVLASSRTLADLESLRDEAETQELSGTIHPLPLDITDRKALAEGLAAATRESPLALAVLNAGSHSATRLDEFGPGAVDPILRVNLEGTLNSLYATLPLLRNQGQGQIAVVASVAGYIGLPTAAAYGLTKAGLINLCEALQPELAAEGIHLQIVNPGFIRTPLTDRNSFSMPFLMESEAAAAALVRGLRGKGFEIVFPRRFVFPMKLLRLLPYGLALRLTARLIAKEASR